MEKYYTVMELASLVGVPRTTINDWLGKYSLYINSIQQGKRKVYPESALAILKEIAAFRNEGCSFPEIGEKLAKEHPVQPEVAAAGDTLPLMEEKIQPEMGGGTSSPADAPEEGKVLSLSTHNGEEVPVKKETPAGGENANLPVLNQAAIAEDFERLGTALALLSEKLAQAEEKRSRSFRKGMLAVFLPLFLLILLLGGGGVWYFGKLTASNEELQNKTRDLSGALEKAQQDSLAQAAASEKKLLSAMERNRKEQEKLKKENAASLRKAEENHAKMLEKLTKATLDAIEKNRKEFPVILEKELAKRLTEKELLWHKEREKWAKERLLFLQKLEQEKSKNKAKPVKVEPKKTFPPSGNAGKEKNAPAGKKKEIVPPAKTVKEEKKK